MIDSNLPVYDISTFIRYRLRLTETLSVRFLILFTNFKCRHKTGAHTPQVFTAADISRPTSYSPPSKNKILPHSSPRCSFYHSAYSVILPPSYFLQLYVPSVTLPLISPLERPDPHNTAVML